MAVTRADYEELYARTNYAQIPGSWFTDDLKIKRHPNGTWHRRIDFVVSWYHCLKIRDPLYDWGCGANIPKRILETHHDIKVVGIDFARGASPDLVMDVTDVPSTFRPDGDGFISFDMMEHIYEHKLPLALDYLVTRFRSGMFTIAYNPEHRQYGQREQLHVTLHGISWWARLLARYWPCVIHIGRKIWAVGNADLAHTWFPRQLLLEHYGTTAFAGSIIEGAIDGSCTTHD